MVYHIHYVVGCDVAMDFNFSSTPSHPVVGKDHMDNSANPENLERSSREMDFLGV